MSQEMWSSVDRYLNETLHLADPSLDAALEATAAAGPPAISVAPNQGSCCIIQTVGAKGYDGLTFALVNSDQREPE